MGTLNTLYFYLFLMEYKLMVMCIHDGDQDLVHREAESYTKVSWQVVITIILEVDLTRSVCITIHNVLKVQVMETRMVIFCMGWSIRIQVHLTKTMIWMRHV